MKYINNWDRGSVSVRWRCLPVFVWHGVEATQMLAGWSDAVFSVDQLLWHLHSCPKQIPTYVHRHTPEHTHTRTEDQFVTLSQPPRAGPQWWWKQKSDCCQSREAQADMQTHTVKDQSEDTEWLHDPSTSTIEDKTFIFPRWHVKLHFIYNPDIKALKCDNKKGDKKTFEAHIKKKDKKNQSTLLEKRWKFLLYWFTQKMHFLSNSLKPCAQRRSHMQEHSGASYFEQADRIKAF